MAFPIIPLITTLLGAAGSAMQDAPEGGQPTIGPKPIGLDPNAGISDDQMMKFMSSGSPVQSNAPQGLLGQQPEYMPQQSSMPAQSPLGGGLLAQQPTGQPDPQIGSPVMEGLANAAVGMAPGLLSSGINMMVGDVMSDADEEPMPSWIRPKGSMSQLGLLGSLSSPSPQQVRGPVMQRQNAYLQSLLGG